MSYIHDIVMAHLPMHRKTSVLGWINCNAVCCHHRGHRQDVRLRGNFLFENTGGIIYNCYNCGFKAKFDTTSLSESFESLMNWMGITREDISKIKLELLNNKLNGIDVKANSITIKLIHEFHEISLPEGAISFESVIEEENIPESFMNVFGYLMNRGNAIANGWDYYWSAKTKWSLKNRIIIPFYQAGKIVGWTARYAGIPPNKDTPRYFNSDLQTGYLFNCDILNNMNREFVLLVEGPFDAIALSCIGTLGSELNKNQIAWLNSTDKIKIVVPDRQRKNQGLIDTALDNNWFVSFPEWEEDIKDAADAACRYGKLFALRSVIAARTDSKLAIGIKRKMFRK
jgi:hypothetical protein